jgi:hypothetical protein
MKRLKILGIFMGMFFFLTTACSIEEKQIEVDSDKIELSQEQLRTMGIGNIKIPDATNDQKNISKSNYKTKIVNENTGLTSYTDESEFINDACNSLVLEDFEPTYNIDGGNVIEAAFASPLDELTDNHVFSVGEIVPGILIEPSSLRDDSNYNAHLLSYSRGPGLFRVRTLYNYPENINQLIVRFTKNDVKYVGFMVSKLNTANNVRIEVFGVSDTTPIETFYQFASLEGTFFGIKSEEAITKITIYDENDGWESIDDLRFGSCDLDIDGDGVNDDVDNCPETANSGQEDNDGDTIGDACDDDDDNDGVLDENDNCPFTVNSDQEDYDVDGVGDACDDDDDNDGCLDGDDSIPFSNIEATVVIDGCDSNVENRVTSTCGISMSDMLDELEAGTYQNHGKFVQAVSSLTRSWVKEGLISKLEKDAIMSCAGSANIP